MPRDPRADLHTLMHRLSPEWQRRFELTPKARHPELVMELVRAVLDEDKELSRDEVYVVLIGFISIASAKKSNPNLPPLAKNPKPVPS